MSDRKTPRTDAFVIESCNKLRDWPDASDVFDHATRMTNFARDLERECEELREAFDAACDFINCQPNAMATEGMRRKGAIFLQRRDALKQ